MVGNMIDQKIVTLRKIWASPNFCHSPPIFAQLRSTLFAFAAQANPNAGCKCQVGESI